MFRVKLLGYFVIFTFLHMPRLQLSKHENWYYLEICEGEEGVHFLVVKTSLVTIFNFFHISKTTLCAYMCSSSAI